MQDSDNNESMKDLKQSFLQDNSESPAFSIPWLILSTSKPSWVRVRNDLDSIIEAIRKGRKVHELLDEYDRAFLSLDAKKLECLFSDSNDRDSFGNSIFQRVFMFNHDKSSLVKSFIEKTPSQFKSFLLAKQEALILMEPEIIQWALDGVEITPQQYIDSLFYSASSKSPLAVIKLFSDHTKPQNAVGHMLFNSFGVAKTIAALPFKQLIPYLKSIKVTKELLRDVVFYLALKGKEKTIDYLVGNYRSLTPLDSGHKLFDKHDLMKSGVNTNHFIIRTSLNPSNYEVFRPYLNMEDFFYSRNVIFATKQMARQLARHPKLIQRISGEGIFRVSSIKDGHKSGFLAALLFNLQSKKDQSSIDAVLSGSNRALIREMMHIPVTRRLVNSEKSANKMVELFREANLISEHINASSLPYLHIMDDSMTKALPRARKIWGYLEKSSRKPLRLDITMGDNMLPEVGHYLIKNKAKELPGNFFRLFISSFRHQNIIEGSDSYRQIIDTMDYVFYTPEVLAHFRKKDRDFFMVLEVLPSAEFSPILQRLSAQFLPELKALRKRKTYDTSLLRAVIMHSSPMVLRNREILASLMKPSLAYEISSMGDLLISYVAQIANTESKQQIVKNLLNVDMEISNRFSSEKLWPLLLCSCSQKDAGDFLVSKNTEKFNRFSELAFFCSVNDMWGIMEQVREGQNSSVLSFLMGDDCSAEDIKYCQNNYPMLGSTQLFFDYINARDLKKQAHLSLKVPEKGRVTRNVI